MLESKKAQPAQTQVEKQSLEEGKRVATVSRELLEIPIPEKGLTAVGTGECAHCRSKNRTLVNVGLIPLQPYGTKRRELWCKKCAGEADRWVSVHSRVEIEIIYENPTAG